MSERPSTRCPSPRACSGLMYAGVPASPAPLPYSSSRRARPKSATQGRPAASSRMFAGLHVAVDQAAGVRVVQRLGDRRHQLGRFAERRPALAGAARPGRSPSMYLETT